MIVSASAEPSSRDRVISRDVGNRIIAQDATGTLEIV